MERLEIVVATRNRKKFREIKSILKEIKEIRLIPLWEIKDAPPIKEDGKSFFENARKKALRISLYTGKLSLGEDSGLLVSHLRGLPGIYSARFARKGDDLKNNLKLLRLLRDVPWRERKAEFVCSLVLVGNQKVLKSSAGRCRGFIEFKMKGRRGFGYDPLFYLPQYRKTMAQLSLKEKNKISHRAKALFKLKNFLCNYIEGERSI